MLLGESQNICGHEKVAAEIRDELLLSPWLESAYPMVYVGYDKNGKSYPYYVSPDEKIVNLLPHKEISSMSFLEMDQLDVSDVYQGDYDTVHFSLIVWLNSPMVEKINYLPIRTGSSEFIDDIIIRLQNKRAFDIRVEHEPKKILGKYTLFDEKSQAVGGRQFLFKITFKVHFLPCRKLIIVTILLSDGFVLYDDLKM